MYKAIHIETGMERAIKVIKKKNIGDNLKHTIAEIENLKKVDHPNIVKLFELYTSNKYIYLVQEYLKGEQLYTRLSDLENLDEGYARMLFK